LFLLLLLAAALEGEEAAVTLLVDLVDLVAAAALEPRLPLVVLEHQVKVLLVETVALMAQTFLLVAEVAAQAPQALVAEVEAVLMAAPVEQALHHQSQVHL
jgi:hypothetical protein